MFFFMLFETWLVYKWRDGLFVCVIMLPAYVTVCIRWLWMIESEEKQIWHQGNWAFLINTTRWGMLLQLTTFSISSDYETAQRMVNFPSKKRKKCRGVEMTHKKKRERSVLAIYKEEKLLGRCYGCLNYSQFQRVLASVVGHIKLAL